MRRRVKKLSAEATAALEALAARTGCTYQEALLRCNRRGYDDSNEILVFCETLAEFFPPKGNENGASDAPSSAA